jgi:hypothetical protein
MKRAAMKPARVFAVAVWVAGWLATVVLPVEARPKRKSGAQAPSAAERSIPPAASREPQPTEAAPLDPEPAQVSVSPAAEPPLAATAEPAPAATATPADGEQVASLSSELTSLMDDLVQARARAAVVGKTLWKTVIRVNVQNLAEDEASLAKLVLKLDGAPIYRGDGSTLRGDDSRQVFEGFVAPGPHVLSAEIEQNSREDSAYGYSLRETYRFLALRDKRNELELVLADDSDVTSEADEQDGEYDIRTRLRVRTKELEDE